MLALVSLAVVFFSRSFLLACTFQPFPLLLTDRFRRPSFRARIRWSICAPVNRINCTRRTKFSFFFLSYLFFSPISLCRCVHAFVHFILAWLSQFILSVLQHMSHSKQKHTELQAQQKHTRKKSTNTHTQKLPEWERRAKGFRYGECVYAICNVIE